MLIWIYVFDVSTYIWESHLMRYVTCWNLGRERMMSSDWIVRIDIRIFFENSTVIHLLASALMEIHTTNNCFGATRHETLPKILKPPVYNHQKNPPQNPHAITPLTYLFVCPLLTFALRPSDVENPSGSFQYWSSHFEMLRIDNSRTSLNNSSSKSTLPQVLCRAAETNLLPSISNHFCSDSDRTGSDGAKAKVRIISNVASRCHWDKALPCDRFVRCDDECFLVSAKVCLSIKLILLDSTSWNKENH